MTRRAYDLPTEQKIIQAYQAGATTYELAREFGGTNRSVSNALERHGIPRRAAGKKPGWQGSAEQKAEVLRLYAQLGHVRDVSRALKCRTDRIAETLTEAGIELGPRRGKPRFRGQVATKIARAYEAGETLSSLAERYSTNTFTIANTLRRAGVAVRDGGRPKFWTEERIAKMSAEFLAGRSQTDIANDLGIGQSAVSRMLYNTGVLRREVPSGPDSPFWQGGRCVIEGGYISVLPVGDDIDFCRPNASGRVLEHRLVMGRALDRPLTDYETVHHIDGDHGNNALDNLQLRFGKHGKGVALECRNCGSHNVQPVPLKG